MNLQYLSDENGHVIAVQVPIKEWETMRSKYPEIEISAIDLPDWQKELINSRLKSIAENPNLILPVSSLMEELDRAHE